jgi:hypothetical protein
MAQRLPWWFAPCPFCGANPLVLCRGGTTKKLELRKSPHRARVDFFYWLFGRDSLDWPEITI